MYSKKFWMWNQLHLYISNIFLVKMSDRAFPVGIRLHESDQCFFKMLFLNFSWIFVHWKLLAMQYFLIMFLLMIGVLTLNPSSLCTSISSITSIDIFWNWSSLDMYVYSKEMKYPSTSSLVQCGVVIWSCESAISIGTIWYIEPKTAILIQLSRCHVI